MTEPELKFISVPTELFDSLELIRKKYKYENTSEVIRKLLESFIDRKLKALAEVLEGTQDV